MSAPDDLTASPHPRRMGGTRLPLLLLAALLLVAAVQYASPVVAHAETSGASTQAAAASAAFLLTAPPPPQTAGICLVDTGVASNADTSAVVERLALSGDPSDHSPTLHGTTMAMHIAAPANGWGMVGLWPSAHIVSVRANVADQDDFTPAGYINGIKRCNEVAADHGLKVILLALSSNAPLSGEDAEQLSDVVQAARAGGLSVVAAAGNTSGAPLTTPANVPGVLSVGATDTATGGLCPFSASGALLLAPGCGLDAADPTTGQPDGGQQGTSHAAALAAAALAALRSYKPELTPAVAEQTLNDTATPTAAGRRLNLTAAFTAQGLAAMTGAAAPPLTPTPVPPVVPDLTPKPKARWPKPSVAVSTHRHGRLRTLTIRARNRPRGAIVQVQVYARAAKNQVKRVRRATKQSSRLTVRVRAWTKLTVRYHDPSGRYLQSVAATVRAATRAHRS